LRRTIETISAGFEVISKRAWILLVPIALDLFLWWGPKISLYPLIQRALGWMNQLYAQADYETWTSIQQLWGELNIPQLWEQFGRQFNLVSIVPSINIMSFLSLGLLDMPSVIAVNNVGDGPANGTVPVVEISNGFLLIGLIPLLLGVGLLIAIVYQSLIAQQVREEHITFRYLLRRLGRYWAYVAVVALALAALLALIGGPLVLVLFIIGALSPLLMQMLFFAASALLFWFGIYLLFIPQGILLGEETPLRALWASVSVVRSNFWSVLLLLFLSRLIRSGLSFVWPLFTHTTPGTLFAIVGNAFSSGGLAAASFIFYRDRFVAWRERMESILQEQ